MHKISMIVCLRKQFVSAHLLRRKPHQVEGRMVSLKDAVNEPDLDMVITAAIKSGLKPEIERESCTTKTWHPGRVYGKNTCGKKRP